MFTNREIKWFIPTSSSSTAVVVTKQQLRRSHREIKDGVSRIREALKPVAVCARALVCVCVCVCERATSQPSRAAVVRLFFFFFLPGITKPGGDKGATQFDNSTRSRAKTPTSRRLLSFLLDWLPSLTSLSAYLLSLSLLLRPQLPSSISTPGLWTARAGTAGGTGWIHRGELADNQPSETLQRRASRVVK